MKNHVRSYFGLCILMGYFVNVLLCAYAQAQGTRARANRNVGQIVIVQGNARVRPPNSQRGFPARLGLPVRQSDQIYVPNQGQVTVLCTDGTRRDLVNGSYGPPCRTASNQPLIYKRHQVKPTRGDGPNLAFPVIISPRKTKLIGTNPILRWTPVAGETEYRVKIIGDDFEWGTTVKSKTELIYPTNAPALLPGKTYKLTVTMGAHSSDDEGQPDLGFTILNAEKTKEAREAEKKIGKLKLPETPTKFLIAQLYRDFGLNAEAIEVLKDLPNAANEVAPALELGELYIAIGLNRLAEESYLHALDLAEKADEIFGQSLAEYALGQIYEALGNKDEAIKRWQKAGELCQQLGDDEMVKKIKASLNSLQ